MTCGLRGPCSTNELGVGPFRRGSIPIAGGAVKLTRPASSASLTGRTLPTGHAT